MSHRWHKQEFTRRSLRSRLGIVRLKKNSCHRSEGRAFSPEVKRSSVLTIRPNSTVDAWTLRKNASAKRHDRIYVTLSKAKGPLLAGCFTLCDSSPHFPPKTVTIKIFEKKSTRLCIFFSDSCQESHFDLSRV